MEKENYIFTPAAGAPTVKKIRKFTYLLLGVITFVATIALFSRETIWQLGFIFLVWLILCAYVIILVSTNVYVIEVRINPIEGVLYFSFMNYKGEVGYRKIDIKQAKYTYKERATKSGGYGLTIKGNHAKLQIGETRSENKNQANVFFRSQLDEMNQIILQVKGQDD
jgi:Ca2+/Na+ antiporter